jgi:hypothetical protein
MSNTINQKYGSSGQSVSITLDGLANTSARRGAAVDNRTATYQDVLVSGQVKAGAAPDGSGVVNVYLYGTVDDGTNFSDGADGTDAAHTLAGNAIPLGSVTVNAAATVFKFGPWNIADACGGRVPGLWGLIFENQSGDALDNAGGNNVIKYQGISAQIV